MDLRRSAFCRVTAYTSCTIRDYSARLSARFIIKPGNFSYLLFVVEEDFVVPLINSRFFSRVATRRAHSNTRNRRGAAVTFRATRKIHCTLSGFHRRLDITEKFPPPPSLSFSSSIKSGIRDCRSDDSIIKGHRTILPFRFPDTCTTPGSFWCLGRTGRRRYGSI